MAATTTLLGLVTPTQGTLSGTWGDTVNYGISDYVDISVAGTLTLTNDGAVTLANTTGSSSGNSITSSLTGAGTVTAQFAIVKVTGTLTVAKVVTGPSYSKTYTVVNSATGGIVTFKASGQTGVSIAVGESAFVYFNGTDYVKVSGTVAVASFQTSLGGLTPSTATTGVVTLAGTLNTTSGGTGLTSFTAGDVPYYASGSVLSKLAIGTAGQFLTSTGTAPQWSTLSGVAVTTFSAGTTGFTPSSATSGAVTLAGTLATTNGGTGLTSFTSGGVVYASSSSALATGSVLTFDGQTLTNTRTTPVLVLNDTSASNLALRMLSTGGVTYIQSGISAGAFAPLAFTNNGGSSELMRLNTTGLGIGTSSISGRLDIANTGSDTNVFIKSDTTRLGQIVFNDGASQGIIRYDHSTDTMSLFSGGTQNLFLNSSGNLGLRVTPSAWNSALRALEVNVVGNSIMSGGSSDMYVTSNAYFNASNSWIYANTAAASIYQLASGQHRWSVAASGTAGNAITFTQAMTLDASGNLGVGATSIPAGFRLYASGGSMLLDNNTAFRQKDSVGNNTLMFTLSSGNNFELGSGTHTGGMAIVTGNSNITFTTNSAERARIDSSGNLLVGGTAARGTTVGTAHLDLFNGTAPAGTLTNGVSLYSSSGDLKFMNAAGDAFDVGYRNIPQNSQSANYTLVLGDAGDHIFHPVGDNNARTFTIPANSSVAFPIGTAITFINMAAANVTIAITTDTMYLSSAGTTGSRTLAQYGSATAIKITSTNWLISGSGLT